MYRPVPGAVSWPAPTAGARDCGRRLRHDRVRLAGPQAGSARTRHKLISTMRAFWSYTVLRLAIFAALLLILLLIGFGGILAAAIAAVVSAIISYTLLARLRERMAGSIAHRVTRVRQGLDAGAKAEDVD
jgi:hypothetical protein